MGKTIILVLMHGAKDTYGRIRHSIKQREYIHSDGDLTLKRRLSKEKKNQKLGYITRMSKNKKEQ